MFQGEVSGVQPAPKCSIGSGDFSLHCLLNLILEESSLNYLCGFSSSLVVKHLDSGGRFFFKKSELYVEKKFASLI